MLNIRTSPTESFIPQMVVLVASTTGDPPVTPPPTLAPTQRPASTLTSNSPASAAATMRTDSTSETTTFLNTKNHSTTANGSISPSSTSSPSTQSIEPSSTTNTTGSHGITTTGATSVPTISTASLPLPSSPVTGTLSQPEKPKRSIAVIIGSVIGGGLALLILSICMKRWLTKRRRFLKLHKITALPLDGVANSSAVTLRDEKIRIPESLPRRRSDGSNSDFRSQSGDVNHSMDPEVRAQFQEMAERIARLEADQAPPDYRSSRTSPNDSGGRD
ncbi:hypothetical protein PM082_012592 [Marasmius tenuissimus]|nr:hypothetical protein PM082_012592 [Marasmius tenuissimus]